MPVYLQVSLSYRSCYKTVSWEVWSFSGLNPKTMLVSILFSFSLIICLMLLHWLFEFIIGDIKWGINWWISYTWASHSDFPNTISQVEGLCKLLNQSSESLKSIEFIHCKLSPDFVNAICDSLHMKGHQSHGVEHFSIKRSSFLQADSAPVPVGLTRFLTSGRYAHIYEWLSCHTYYLIIWWYIAMLNLCFFLL